MNRAAALLLAATLAIIAVLQGFAPAIAQGSEAGPGPGEAREALAIARAQQRSARLRAERLEAEAGRAGEAAAKALTQAAALAARVQEAEALVGAAEAELAIAERDRRVLAGDLAKRREPLARLAGALQTMARRPIALAVLQPGSLRDAVHTRAVLGSAVPVVRARTAGVRVDLDRLAGLEAERSRRLASSRAAQERLEERRRDVLALAEKEQVLAARAAGGADREALRAAELAEEARTLDALVGEIENQASLRSRLASLDGPVARPLDPRAAAAPRPARTSRGISAPQSYVLPVAGRVTQGFGEATTTGSRRPGIELQPRPGALVVAPGGGRVAFAGAYEGYGMIAIVEHDGGWTSLVTGLSSLAVTTGQTLRAGSPLGRANTAAPRIGLELRHDGKPVNPLSALR